jgi:hypothetical protein
VSCVSAAALIKELVVAPTASTGQGSAELYSGDKSLHALEELASSVRELTMWLEIADADAGWQPRQK